MLHIFILQKLFSIQRKASNKTHPRICLDCGGTYRELGHTKMMFCPFRASSVPRGMIADQTHYLSALDLCTSKVTSD